jgi:hypothetical protein
MRIYGMSAISNAKAEPTDPIRGILNDFIWDPLGLPRVEQALGTPADVIHAAGLPTIKDFLPTPFDAFSDILNKMREGSLTPPQLPSVPPPPPIPNIFARPGEGVATATTEAPAVKAATGSEYGMARQRYYQRY